MVIAMGFMKALAERELKSGRKLTWGIVAK
jgi:hypothetical protein